MKKWLSKMWPLGKIVLTVTILIFVGMRFSKDLQELDLSQLPFRLPWLIASGLLYLIGIGFSGWAWFHLMRRFGEKPDLYSTYRAYYIGHLGKYIPGKAVSLIMRGTLVRSANVKMGVAIITSFYEVLTTMAAGALLAAVLFSIQPPSLAGLKWNPIWIGLLLLGLVGIPLLPGVFNRLVKGLAARFQKVESFRLPHLRMVTLVQVLLITGAGWLVLGLSLWCVTQTIASEWQPLTVSSWLQYTAMVCLAYVVGFLAIFVPGGIGVREFFLQPLLAPSFSASATLPPAAVATMAVLLLRSVWTAAEVLLAGLLYFMGNRNKVDDHKVIQKIVNAPESEPLKPTTNQLPG